MACSGLGQRRWLSFEPEKTKEHPTHNGGDCLVFFNHPFTATNESIGTKKIAIQNNGSQSGQKANYKNSRRDIEILNSGCFAK
jgi:hypothetical protein